MDVFGLEDVPQLLEGKELEEVHESFQEEVEEITGNSEKYENSELKLGFELEYTLLDEDNQQASEDARDRIKETEGFLDSELAASVIEARTDPVSPDSLDDLFGEVLEKENRTLELAGEEGLDLLRYGTNPFPSVEEFERTSGPRYDAFAQFLDENRNDSIVDESFGKSDIDPRDIHYSGMIASTQTNIQAQGLRDAVEKANLAYMFAPYAEAIGGNARILEQEDTGVSDLRIPVWEDSADIRTDEQFENGEAPRAGRIDSYYGKENGEDIQDYFERLDPIYVAPDVDEAPDAIDQAIMNNWKDVNIKFNRDSGEALVELRPFSIQPSPTEDLAVSAFMVGRMAYAQLSDEQLLDIDLVNENRKNAMYSGLDTQLYDSSGNQRDAVEVLREEIEYARQGLEEIGLGYELDGRDIFDQAFGKRLETGLNPGDLSAERYNELRDEMPDREALTEVMEDYKVRGEDL